MAALADKFNIKPVELETLITVLFYIVSSIAIVLGVYGFTFCFSMTKVGKILRKAGNVSYEIYLIHGFVFYHVANQKGKLISVFGDGSNFFLCRMFAHTFSRNFKKDAEMIL